MASDEAQDIANTLRAQASPAEIKEWARVYDEYGREPIREEAEDLVDADEETIEEVTDLVIRGLKKVAI